MDTEALRYKVDLPQNMQFSAIFDHFLTSRGPHWPSMVPMDANMQVSLPWKNRLVTGISAGFVYCGNPKKSKIHCCRRVFVIFWACSMAQTSPPTSFRFWIAWHNVGPSRCHNRDKMDTVALSYKVDSPQNMQFCPIFGLFLTSRGPHRPLMVPRKKRKYAGEYSWEK